MRKFPYRSRTDNPSSSMNSLAGREFCPGTPTALPWVSLRKRVHRPATRSNSSSANPEGFAQIGSEQGPGPPRLTSLGISSGHLRATRTPRPSGRPFAAIAPPPRSPPGDSNPRSSDCPQLHQASILAPDRGSPSPMPPPHALRPGSFLKTSGRAPTPGSAEILLRTFSALHPCARAAWQRDSILPGNPFSLPGARAQPARRPAHQRAFSPPTAAEA
jgi:hypothetical protein